MKNLLLVVIFFLLKVSGNGQTPTIEWQNCLGGSGGDNPKSKLIQQTYDGGYIVAGTSTSNDIDVTGNHGSNDIWIVKLDVNGNIEWQKSYGGSQSEEPKAILQTLDSGYVFCGSTSSNDGDVSGSHLNVDAWVVKIDQVGNIDWQKCLGGTSTDEAWAMTIDINGDFIITGVTSSTNGDVLGNHGGSDLWVVKLNFLGSIDWQKCYGGIYSEWGMGIDLTSDLGYIIVGHTYSNDGDVSGNHTNSQYCDIWVIKIDSIGTLEWQKCLGSVGNDYSYSIKSVNTGGYILSGDSWGVSGDVTISIGLRDAWIVKLNNAGNIVWQKSYGGTSDDYASTIISSNDGGFIFVGITSSNDVDVSGNHGSNDVWVVRIDSVGTILWQKCIGGTLSEIGYAINKTNDGGLIVGAFTTSNDGDVSGYNGSGDYWIVKLSATLGIHIIDNLKISVFPNPSDANFLIEISSELFGESFIISNLYGQEIFTGKILQDRITIDLSGYANSTYIFSMGKYPQLNKKLVKF